IGAPGRMNYTIVGDTVNTARRMESLGKEVAPDADVVVLASDGTIEAITLEVAYTPVGAFTVKNRIEPVEAFRLKP
ncbi:MAG: adenylate/guanylate cyclase domain-containing protein, partial [Pseudomonadota bacterium]